MNTISSSNPTPDLIKRLGNEVIHPGELMQCTLQMLQLADSGLEPYEIAILAALLTIHQRSGFALRTTVVFKRLGESVTDQYWDLRGRDGTRLITERDNPIVSRIVRGGVTANYYQRAEPGDYVVLLEDRTPTNATIPKHWLVPYA